jgi:hypothetical protein
VVRAAAGALIAYGVVVLGAPQVLPTFMESMDTAAQAASPSTDPEYRFEVVEARPAAPGKTIVTVRLVHVSEGKTVQGASVREAATNMGPGGMAEMTGKVTPLPPDRPGIYGFLIETGMAGKWALTLEMELQAGSHTVRGAVDYDASS